MHNVGEDLCVYSLYLTNRLKNAILIVCKALNILINRKNMNSVTNNFGFKHKCGILMPVSSLPNPYGIGSFGKGAYDFIDLLDACGQKCWQVLPLNPTSYGDSPYQSPASAAGNPYFIDLDLLCNDGLLTAEELKSEKTKSKKVDYGRLFYSRYNILRVAYSRFKESSAYRTFCRREEAWLSDYALFMALKVKNGWRAWFEWSEDEKISRVARKNAEKYADECGFWKWIQFEFFKQWGEVRKYARKKGISIIGDIPIYVAHDSVDVWAAPAQFLLDDDYMPLTVAGCPPDAYAEDGQLWGNPIYDWPKMEREHFEWWIERVRRAFGLYDILRIDHFRGFASYFSIPYGDKNARGGQWEDAPGKALFDTLRAAIPYSKIIAEDLGFITDDVRELLSHTGFPGMKVIQFAFYDEDNEYLPRAYKTDNCVVYSASHDSDCTASWCKTLKGKAKKRFERECPKTEGRSRTEDVIRLAMGSRAELCIIPMQDYLELTNAKGRMNTPSVAEGNWQWRLDEKTVDAELKAKIAAIAKDFGR